MDKKTRVTALLAAASSGIAWWLPGSVFSALLGWIAALCLIELLRSEFRYRALFLFGIVFHPLGFYWLYGTIADFGGFSTVPALLIFSFFVLCSSFQLLFSGFIYKYLPRAAHAAGLGAAAAFTVTEFLSIRIFPWQYAHTQLALSWFSQCAALGGSLLVSFMLFWCAEVLLRFVFCKEREPLFLAAPLCFFALLAYGAREVGRLNAPADAALQRVALVQGNVSIREKHNLHYFEINTARYRELSAEVPGPGTLIVWPETALTQWILSDVGSSRNDPRLPQPLSGNPYLIGSLSAENERALHNSALAIFADGTVPPPYHKMILMPFGEYTPLGDTLPWLKKLNATAGDFTPGTGMRVFEYPQNEALRVAPLICYEDIVAGPAREATQHGATLLVNLTNDAWFGQSAAPYQHNAIAAFRAIENRRILLRSTNSGFTAVISPTGKTLGSLPLFSEGVLSMEVPLLHEKTFYTLFMGDKPWWILSILTACLLIRVKVISRSGF